MFIKELPMEMVGLVEYQNISEVEVVCEDITASHFARLSRTITAALTRSPTSFILIKLDLTVRGDTLDSVDNFGPDSPDRQNSNEVEFLSPLPVFNVTCL